MVAIVPFLRVICMGIYSTTAARGMWLITRYQVHQNWRHGSNVMKSAQDDRLLSANDVINLTFKMAPRLIKRVYTGSIITIHFMTVPFSSPEAVLLLVRIRNRNLWLDPIFWACATTPVVQRLANAIHWINHYPADRVVCFVNTYPLDSDLPDE